MIASEPPFCQLIGPSGLKNDTVGLTLVLLNYEEYYC